MTDHAISEPPPGALTGTLDRTRELAMSAAWHGGLARSLATVDGIPLTVVFRGNWSHGFGPDFADAMIRFGDHDLQTGAVEIHRRASDWNRHGHHLDRRYNSVILHVVSRLDTVDVRRPDGRIVPTVVLDIPDDVLFTIDQQLPGIWDRLGGSVCAEDLAFREPGRLHAALLHLGDQRFTGRTTRFEGELTVDTVDVVMLRGILDGFGYTENREPMGRLATVMVETGALPSIAGAANDQRWTTAAALTFGLSGFLPFSPADAATTGLPSDVTAAIEREWAVRGHAYAAWTLPATAWSRGRTRPANHPASRLTALATVLATTSGNLLPALIDRLHGDGRVEDELRALTRSSLHQGIGAPRAVAIAASVILPVLMAYAHHTGDSELEDAAARSWARLPRSEWSRPARRALAQVAGEVNLGPLGERANQGLLHLDRSLCTPRRCYECPIAAEVIRDRQQSGLPPHTPDV